MNQNLRTLGAAAAVVAVAFVVGMPALAASAPAVTVEVGADEGSVAHDYFWPSTVVVNAGDTVQWKSMAKDTPHTVTAEPKNGPPLFDSSSNLTPTTFAAFAGPGGVLERVNDVPGSVAEFNYTFANPGTYTIRCKIHSEMIETVTVTDDTNARGSVLAIAGAGGAGASVDVFAPANLTISKGQTVNWINLAPTEPHTVTGFAGVHYEQPAVEAPPLFDSSPAVTPALGQKIASLFADPKGFFAPGATFSYTFTAPGTYPYFCKLHSGMKGAVIVLPAPSPGPAGPTGPTGAAGPTGPTGAKSTPGIAAFGALVALAGAAVLLVRRR
ncbi:MAG: cupredoxin domain-containing protein [Thermoplasmatota archaeon]